MDLAIRNKLTALQENLQETSRKCLARCTDHGSLDARKALNEVMDMRTTGTLATAALSYSRQANDLAHSSRAMAAFQLLVSYYGLLYAAFLKEQTGEPAAQRKATWLGLKKADTSRALPINLTPVPMNLHEFLALAILQETQGIRAECFVRSAKSFKETSLVVSDYVRSGKTVNELNFAISQLPRMSAMAIFAHYFEPEAVVVMDLLLDTSMTLLCRINDCALADALGSLSEEQLQNMREVAEPAIRKVRVKGLSEKLDTHFKLLRKTIGDVLEARRVRMNQHGIGPPPTSDLAEKVHMPRPVQASHIWSGWQNPVEGGSDSGEAVEIVERGM
jgi:hypothetical protein